MEQTLFNSKSYAFLGFQAEFPSVNCVLIISAGMAILICFQKIEFLEVLCKVVNITIHLRDLSKISLVWSTFGVNLAWRTGCTLNARDSIEDPGYSPSVVILTSASGKPPCHFTCVSIIIFLGEILFFFFYYLCVCCLTVLLAKESVICVWLQWQWNDDRDQTCCFPWAWTIDANLSGCMTLTCIVSIGNKILSIVPQNYFLCSMSFPWKCCKQ